jgi:hypothetical protein
MWQLHKIVSSQQLGSTDSSSKLEADAVTGLSRVDDRCLFGREGFSPARGQAARDLQGSLPARTLDFALSRHFGQCLCRLVFVSSPSPSEAPQHRRRHRCTELTLPISAAIGGTSARRAPRRPLGTALMGSITPTRCARRPPRTFADRLVLHTSRSRGHPAASEQVGAMSFETGPEQRMPAASTTPAQYLLSRRHTRSKALCHA